MNIILRKFVDNDIEIFETWLKKDYIKKWYSDEEDWINEVTLRDSKFSWIYHFIVKYDKKDIGFCQYYAIANDFTNNNQHYYGNTEIDGTYSIDYLIGEKEYLGKGLGKEIVLKLIEKVFSLDDAKRIAVSPENDNIKSCNTLKSCGFIFDPTNKNYILYKNR